MKVLGWIVLVVVLLAAAAAGVWAYTKKGRREEAGPSTSPKRTATPPDEKTDAASGPKGKAFRTGIDKLSFLVRAGSRLKESNDAYFRRTGQLKADDWGA